MRRLAIVAVLPLLAACTGATGQTAGRTVELRMGEFAYAPAALSLRAGETVTLRLVNAGTVEHEFMAGARATPSRGYAEDLLAGVTLSTSGTDSHGGAGHAGAGVRVPAGKTATVTFTVPAKAGSYEYGCFVAGHYESGMKGRLEIGS